MIVHSIEFDRVVRFERNEKDDQFGNEPAHVR